MQRSHYKLPTFSLWLVNGRMGKIWLHSSLQCWNYSLAWNYSLWNREIGYYLKLILVGKFKKQSWDYLGVMPLLSTTYCWKNYKGRTKPETKTSRGLWTLSNASYPASTSMWFDYVLVIACLFSEEVEAFPCWNLQPLEMLKICLNLCFQPLAYQLLYQWTRHTLWGIITLGFSKLLLPLLPMIFWKG